jgi:antirestriction protein ArdC
MRKQAIQDEALTRARTFQSVMNYRGIFEGFSERGIPMAEIMPRENVFTYNAWLALGRQVRKGEHGVKCVTFVTCKKTDKKTGEETGFRRPWTTTVFHVSQTEPIAAELDATDENEEFAGEGVQS